MSKVSMDPKIEKDLVMAAQKDPQKFTPIYKHYYPHIRRFFAVKLTQAEIIDDLTSQTFEKALKNIKKFSWKGFPFSSWLYKIAHNTLIDHFRKTGRQKDGVMPEYYEPVSEGRSLDEEVQVEFEERLVNELIEKLPKRERKVIYMKFFDGYTNKLIAEKLNISETNVSTIVYRAIEKLRRKMTR